MISKFNNKFVIAGIVLASVIAFGTIYVLAQNGSNTPVSFSNNAEVTIIGTVTSMDDHGFTLTSNSETYYVPIPYDVNRTVLNLNVGSEITIVGYIMNSPMMNFSSYTMIHATSINGIIIDHENQMMNGSGNCGGNGGMGGQGPHGNGMRN